RTPGHPEYGHTDGVETTTGPLGQGIATAIGMAIAERMAAARFNVAGSEPVVDHRTWVFCGDGDLEEGISHEACSLAGHLKLDKFVLFYDSNGITIEGHTDLALSDDAKKRFQAYNWHVLEIDGHDFDQIDRAIRKATKLTGKPVLIICKTHIGKGSPNKQDSHEAHGAPLGEEEVKLTKTALGFDPEKAFYVPQEVTTLFQERASKTKRMQGKWKRVFKEWAKANPGLAETWKAMQEDLIPADIESALPAFDPAKPVATRSASGVVLNALAKVLPQLVGGSADLAPSNKTFVKGFTESGRGRTGRNMHFGIREHAMGAIQNGIAYYGGFLPYSATFFVFMDYMRPAVRLAALSGLHTVYVFTHDSFHVGEDGPTHQPVEHLAAARAIPNLTVIRPADAEETREAWLAALANTSGPTALLLTRQNLPVIDRSAGCDASALSRGAYVIGDPAKSAEVLIMASGSEVSLAVDAAAALAGRGIAARVVSFPSWELFEKQSPEYRESVLPPSLATRVVIEAGIAMGWERYAGSSALFITL
ncbi:MAG TPA: transketolase, partial [Opitutaceae bacterium]|nr:transketolase [Opitutaceae bacterium]